MIKPLFCKNKIKSYYHCYKEHMRKAGITHTCSALLYIWPDTVSKGIGDFTSATRGGHYDWKPLHSDKMHLSGFKRCC